MKASRAGQPFRCLTFGLFATLGIVAAAAQEAQHPENEPPANTSSPTRTAYEWSAADKLQRSAAVPGARHVFVPRGRGKIFDEKSELDELKLSAPQTEGRYTIQDEHWHPGYVIQAHYHKIHAETFYLIDGEFEWTVAGEKRLLKAGDIVYIPPNTVHSVRVVGNQDAHVLFIDQPGGYEETEERERSFTAQELAQPKTQALLRELGDIYPVEACEPLCAARKK